MKTFIEVLALNGQYDKQGIDNPHDWYWTEVNGVYYPKTKIDFEKKSA
jgi:hypothetical protein